MITSALPGRFRRAGLTMAVAAVTAILPAASAQATARSAGYGPRPAAARPPGREWASFAYDPAHHDFVLFGGQTSATTVLGDTWVRKNEVWTQLTPSHSPSPRTGAAIVYDAATRQLLLFGGSARPFSGGGYHGDTWIWTGRTWHRLHPASSPSPRHNADMFYDAATHNVILFGGYDGHYLGDTWSWNGSTWTQLSPATSPSARDSEALVYDQATQTAIMYGGFNDDRLSDTWSWDGSIWTQLSSATSPGPVTVAWQAAYDPASQQVLLFGGDPGAGNPRNQTWAWTGITWTELSPAISPPGRVYGSLAYNSTDRLILLFAGSTNGPETRYPSRAWNWDGTTWHRAN